MATGVLRAVHVPSLTTAYPYTRGDFSAAVLPAPHVQRLSNSFVNRGGLAGAPLQSRSSRRASRLVEAQAIIDGQDNSTVSQWSNQMASMAGQQRGMEDPYSVLLRQRVVVLGNQMDDFVADTIISQLLLLDASDPKRDIRLMINCAGGSITSALGIYDAIQLCQADVSTIGMGLVASTAAIVLMGGTKGKRFAMPNTRIMVHQPLGGASGQALDVEIQAREIMHHKKNITRIMSEITGKPEWQIEKDTDRDRYMSPIEAMEYGIIDSVIDRENIIPLQPLPDKVLARELRSPLWARS